jgi:hypothetical protein
VLTPDDIPAGDDEMLRIRTIKPEFFTSDDICNLTAYARLLYIGLWCAADREGRLEWKPRQFKRQFLPDDEVAIDELCQELIGNELVVLYGEGLAYIPGFTKHQVINNREAQSSLPEPGDTCPTRAPRVDDTSPTRHGNYQGEGKGREGKGKEGNGRGDASPSAAPTRKQGSRMSPDWMPTDADIEYAAKLGFEKWVTLADKFRDHWLAATGPKAVKLDWSAAWRTWCRNEVEFAKARQPATPPPGSRPRFN